MQLVTYISKSKDFNEIISSGCHEVILEHRLLSKFGELTTEELHDYSKKCQEL
ncbi:MAG: hypothetical protein HOJ35_10060, partial [Bdellovibrionales bacterium]|nr:hypothetical protein [Bdellovibrionales bacterium]